MATRKSSKVERLIEECLPQRAVIEDLVSARHREREVASRDSGGVTMRLPEMATPTAEAV